MILDKRLRAPLLAGFFCLAAALAGDARAAEVYQGCAQPGPTGKVWYVDPVNGKTPAAGGLGTQAAPWDSLQGVLSFRFPAGYPRPLLSSVPYYHVDSKGHQIYVNGKALYVADQLGSPPIQPGDTIVLMSGNYGDVAIGDYMAQTANSDFVVVEAGVGQTPVFDTLNISRTNKWVFDGIKVQSLMGTNGNTKWLVTIGDQGVSFPTSDIIFANMQISTADDTTDWTKAQWVAQARNGYYEVGSRVGTSGVPNTAGFPYTTCISMTGSHIHNVRVGAAIMGNNSLFSNDEIDHFGDDGLDYAANNLAITHNSIHDNFDVGDGNHEDAMQGQIGPLAKGVPYNAFSNILIDSNLVIRQTDPKLAFATYLQGIDAFDEDWTNVTVTNNVVVTTACWGIVFSSSHNGKIINNTVVADNLMPAPGNCKPLVVVGDKTHQGPSSSDNIIRNNIANGLSIYNLAPNMTMDHNICLTIEGKCTLFLYVDGKPRGVYRPGDYADHNIIDRRGSEGTFLTFDPAKFVYDLRLRPYARAIGAGNPAEAPPVDITGASRRSPVDVGAYQHNPGK
jgi:parallel beta-helix repeat protein